ncbi:YkvA family protein [Methanosarcina sp. Z-7115]|uniref:YkvA family protein n=1 Tax=Methanosarcina baikalica TaxID=3073890 RepID=A0ABU2D230_9EURY|nr:YkvA family protein [Methanosarcina sp. Z-7115]MDR7666044.1 YkvA family protein [Methanosarcina sp. Z-7115]
MDKIYDVRTEQIEANLEQFKVNPNQLSDTSMIFPETVRRTRSRPTDLRKIWDYLELLFSMLSDSFNKKYPVPKKTVFVITFALLYLISPIDISPDIIPLIGFVDDVAVLAFAFSLIKDDLENYRAWKMSN